MRAMLILLFTLAAAISAHADGAHPCYGLLPDACQAHLQAIGQGGTSSAESGATGQGTAVGTSGAERDGKADAALHMPNRPANLSVSTAAGWTTISWAAPIHARDPAYCAIGRYSVEVIDLVGDNIAWEDQNVFHWYGSVEATGLIAGRQYQVEVRACADHPDCDGCSEPGVYTYQY